ncbi:hypothetical protein HAX54_039383, partial [Datura stramonium]|nr:hypothetical protein [Datura stramonium]
VEFYNGYLQRSFLVTRSLYPSVTPEQNLDLFELRHARQMIDTNILHQYLTRWLREEWTADS